jgi:hypothetical protein
MDKISADIRAKLTAIDESQVARLWRLDLHVRHMNPSNTNIASSSPLKHHITHL